MTITIAPGLTDVGVLQAVSAGDYQGGGERGRLPQRGGAQAMDGMPIDCVNVKNLLLWAAHQRQASVSYSVTTAIRMRTERSRLRRREGVATVCHSKFLRYFQPKLSYEQPLLRPIAGTANSEYRSVGS
jgi:hypothetical protein